MDSNVVLESNPPAQSAFFMTYTAVVMFLLTAVLGFGADLKGLRPRPDRTEYAVTMFNDLLGVAAELVPAEKVRKLFGSEVDSRYLVVEDGVYPRVKNPIEVRPADFAIRVSRTRDMFRPQVPKGVSDITHSLTSIARELFAKCLPETSTFKPVAGYLYFPILDRKDNREYELEYKARETRMILPLHAESGGNLAFAK
jgi:hypothetical protein